MCPGRPSRSLFFLTTSTHFTIFLPPSFPIIFLIPVSRHNPLLLPAPVPVPVPVPVPLTAPVGVPVRVRALPATVFLLCRVRSACEGIFMGDFITVMPLRIIAPDDDAADDDDDDDDNDDDDAIEEEEEAVDDVVGTVAALNTAVAVAVAVAGAGGALSEIIVVLRKGWRRLM